MGDSSILDTIKEMVLGNAADDSFDTDILVLINNAFSKLISRGVGPATGFSIADSTSTWDQFLPEQPQLIPILQTYVYADVRVGFDVSVSSVVRDVMKQIADENSWRLQIELDKT